MKPQVLPIAESEAIMNNIKELSIRKICDCYLTPSSKMSLRADTIYYIEDGGVEGNMALTLRTYEHA